MVAGCKKDDDSGYTASAPATQEAVAADSAVAGNLPGAASKSLGTALRSAMLQTPGNSSTEAQAQVRQVIRKAELDVRVENVEKAEKEVASIVQSVGGYTETASSTDLASMHPTLTLTLRVPVSTFDSSIVKFEALGVRLSKKIGSEDITGQLVDLDARLKTMRAQEETYRTMLKNHGQLSDVIKIQNELMQIRTDIESVAGQRKSQAGLAALSTIALTLEQNAVAAPAATTDPNWLTQAWGEAWTGAGATFRIIVVGLVWVLAFSPIWIVILLILWRVLKPTVAKKTPGAPVKP